MAGPWERLFIAAARLFAWSVVFTPIAVVAMLVVAALTGQHGPDTGGFLSGLAVSLLVTLAIAALCSALGASIGIGCALLSQELYRGSWSRILAVPPKLLSAVPAAVLGWFGAILVLPAMSGRSGLAVFAAAAAVVTMAVIPRAYALAACCFDAVPRSFREIAAAAGAHPARIAAHVTLPESAQRIGGIFADAFSRAVGEAAAVTVVFLAAARAGYPLPVFLLPSAILSHARWIHAVDANVAQSAALILALAAISKALAARRIGTILWT